MTNKIAVVCLVASCFLAVCIQSTAAAGLAECFDCICRGKNDCGITYEFWVDSGKPGGSYGACMADPVCPRQSMENYYTRFQQDCNGDGATNCYDFARLHILGGFGCTHGTKPELTKIEQCLG